ncbi:hypothetical protein ACFFRR_009264 [Megaselia abdita]
MLNDTLASKRKTFSKNKSMDTLEESIEDEDDSKVKVEYFKTNFSMEQVYKIIEQSIEERLIWDRFNRMYDSYRSLQLIKELSADIRDRVKMLRNHRHRIICIMNIIEKQNQGVCFRMMHLIDSRFDNFANFVYERASYHIVVTVFLVKKD